MSDTWLLVIAVVGLIVFLVALWYFQKRGLEDEPNKPHAGLTHRGQMRDEGRRQ
jgi:hypothetical protein